MSQNHSSLPPPDPKFVLREGMGPVSCVEFGSEDTLFAGTQDGWVHVWDLNINRRKASFHAGNAVCLAIRIILNKLVIQIKSENISIWSLSEPYELHHKVENPYTGFCRIEIDSCLTIFIPAENAEIRVMNLHSFEIVNTLSCPSDKLGEVMVMKCYQYQFRNLLLVGYESGHIFLWDVSEGIRIGQFKIDNIPMAIDFDQVNGKGVCGTESESVILFRIGHDFSFSIEKSMVITNPGVSAVTIRPDKKVMVLGCWDGNLRVYSWKSGRILGVLSEHAETINALSYSSKVIKMWNSVILAAASKDKSISLWSFF